MPILCVLRHAKSDRSAGTADHDRPLAPRGRAAAPRVGRWLREHGLAPALVLCSSARRAVETLRALGDIGAGAVDISDDLYLAPAGELLQRLRSVPEGCSPVLLVGHNPGLQQLVVDLTGGGGEARRPARAFPTAAVAVLEIDGSWSALDRGAASLAAFVRARELA